MIVTVIGDSANLLPVSKILSVPRDSLSSKPQPLTLRDQGKPFSHLPAILLVPSKVRPMLEFKFWVNDVGMKGKTVNDYLIYITHYWSQVFMHDLFGTKFWVSGVQLQLVKAGFMTELTVSLNLTNLGTSNILDIIKSLFGSLQIVGGEFTTEPWVEKYLKFMRTRFL